MTPLLALVAFLLGVFAVLVTPREEEPQIDVTMADVLVAFPGASAKDVENLVARPAEQVLSRMHGVEHVYSVSRPGMAVITVQFDVGVKYNDAVLRLYDTVHSHRDWLPPNLGVQEPVIKPRGIDDVPILALTFWTKGSGTLGLRAAAGGARRRDRTEAHQGHARRVDPRRPRPRHPRADGRRADERLWRHAAGNRRRAQGVERPAAFRQPDRRQPRGAGADRRLPRIRRRREAAGGRRARGETGVHERRRDGRRRPRPAEALRLVRQPGGRISGGHHPDLQATRRQCRRRGVGCGRPDKCAQKHGDPGRRRSHRHPQLRRNRHREGAAADRQADLRHRLRHRPRLLRAGPARSLHRRRRRHADPGRHAVRLVGVGLHAQPRVAVRADLLDRHPGRRRHRRRREHPPLAGPAPRQAAARDHPAGGRRGRRADHPGDADGHRRAAADGLRDRPDGPVHEPDPDQLVDGYGHLAGRRLRRHALAGAQADEGARPESRPEPIPTP
jgi:hypothetical protein